MGGGKYTMQTPKKAVVAILISDRILKSKNRSGLKTALHND